MDAITTSKAKPSFRIILSSSRVRDAIVVACAALALAAAFPTTGLAWLVPLGTGALFWAWEGASWKRAALLGCLGGLIFFWLDYAWVGYTVGHFVGALGPFVPLGPAIVETPFWMLCAVLVAFTYRRVRAPWSPLGAAAIFTLCEWLRSVGPMGAPFDQLGTTQADGPLRAIAAFGGTYAITLALTVLGAYLADALRRRSWRPLAIAVSCVVVTAFACWLAWPARTAPAGRIPVAAIQGNITQSLKWQPGMLPLSIARYEALTAQAARAHPQIIVWPETVIPTSINEDPVLMRDFSNLARASGALLIVGAQRAHGSDTFNTLYFFARDGAVSTYDKRQLVPFAEYFPAKALLGWLPYIGQLNGGISAGHVNFVDRSGPLAIAPLICWESAFADLAHAQTQAGAQLIVISTDDAWFGPTAGPYMHAQIAQLRAIESGAYVIRAAATGVSGVIAPDGRWLARSGVERQAIVTADVGPRVPTVFSQIGPSRAVAVIAALWIVLMLAARRTHETA
jgi:apolipoprotein N-acyltransferase